MTENELWSINLTMADPLETSAIASSLPSGVLRVRYASAEHAEIARRTIAVDSEIQPLKISKEYEVVGETLVITVRATELRLLRVALNSLFDMLRVVSQSLAQFGEIEVTER